jgi:hypothetical protein
MHEWRMDHTSPPHGYFSLHPGQKKMIVKLWRGIKNYEQSRRPDCSGWLTDRVQKEKVRLCVLHLGFRDESVFANVVHEALFLGNLLSTDFLLPAGLVVLHRGCPDIPVLANEIEVPLLALNLFFSNFGSHLNTSKP